MSHGNVDSAARADTKTAMSLLPPDEDLRLIHTRQYDTRVYLVDDHLIARGAVCDTKPPGALIEGDDAWIDMHHMVVELKVSLPDLTITEVDLVFETFPNTPCPSISDTYQQLVGISIARGFTHKVRELFGGPRGCTHVGALLQALAPAVVQATWALSAIKRREAAKAGQPQREVDNSKFQGNLNTCYLWREDGEAVALIRKGEIPDPPLPAVNRLRELGRDASEWQGY